MATTSGTFKYARTPKIVPSGTTSQSRQIFKVRPTKREVALRQAKKATSAPALTLDPALVASVLSSLPKSTQLRPVEAEILLFLEKSNSVPFDSWPQDYQLPHAMNKLRSVGLVRRRYEPYRFSLTRSGVTLANWLLAALSHAQNNSRTA